MIEIETEMIWTFYCGRVERQEALQEALGAGGLLR